MKIIKVLGLLWTATAGAGLAFSYVENAPIGVLVWFAILIIMGGAVVMLSDEEA